MKIFFTWLLTRGEKFFRFITSSLRGHTQQRSNFEVPVHKRAEKAAAKLNPH
jgi:hypothetical protein